MKQKIMIGIMAAAITMIGIGGLFVFSNKQGQAKEQQLEQRDMAAYQPKTAAQDDLSDSIVQSTNAAAGEENKKNGDYQIVFSGQEDSSIVITKEQAAKTAIEEIGRRVNIENTALCVNLQYFNSSIAKTYKGNVDINQQLRYEFKVNGITGAVYDIFSYERTDTESDVWTRTEKDNGYVNKIICEDNMAAFSKISYDFNSNVNCEIIAGDSYSVNGDFYGYSYSVGMKNEDGVLSLRSEVNGNINEDGNRTSTVTITVPKEQLLEWISGSCACGGLKLSGLNINSASLNVYNGGVEVTDSDIDRCSAVLYCGDLKMNHSVCSDCDIQLYCGSAKFDSWSKGSLDIDLSCGGLEINDMSKGNINAQLSCGSAQINCTGAESDYNYDLSTSLGSNEAGDWQSDGNDIVKDNGADSSITIDNSLGMNTVTFQGK